MSKLTPAPFTGGEGSNFELWLKKFEACSRANSWDESAQADKLPALLDGAAFQVYCALDASAYTVKKADNTLCVSYKLLAAALKKEFEPSVEVSLIEFRSRYWKEGEELDVFFSDLGRLVSRALPDVGKVAQDTLVREQFVLGLRRDVSLQAQVLQATPKSARNALDVSKQLLSHRKIIQADEGDRQAAGTGEFSAAVTSTPPVSQDDVHRVNTRLDNLEKKIAELVSLVSNMQSSSVIRNDGTRPRANRRNWGQRNTCFNCHEEGHFAYQCTRGSPSGRRQSGNE